jgi:hypothetical protein
MPLFRRRQVWLPTLGGALLLIGLAGTVLVALALAANGLLAPQAPARGPDGRGARTLVVEGWLGAYELAQVATAIRGGRYERVLTTGGPLDLVGEDAGATTYAARAAAWLRARGLGDVPVVAVPAPASARDRTYVTALMVRDWARQSGLALDAIDLYSVGVHARRSRWLYRLALGPGVEVGVLAAAPGSFDTERWWASSAGAKAVIGEVVGLAWTACCFWPPAPSSDEDQRDVPGTSKAPA